MTDLAHAAPRTLPTTTHTKGYVGIFVVSFAMLLVVALCAQIVAFRWQSWFPGAEDEKSLLGSVKVSVYTFMSYLT